MVAVQKVVSYFRTGSKGGRQDWGRENNGIMSSIKMNYSLISWALLAEYTLSGTTMNKKKKKRNEVSALLKFKLWRQAILNQSTR